MLSFRAAEIARALRLLSNKRTSPLPIAGFSFLERTLSPKMAPVSRSEVACTIVHTNVRADSGSAPAFGLRDGALVVQLVGAVHR